MSPRLHRAEGRFRRRVRWAGAALLLGWGMEVWAAAPLSLDVQVETEETSSAPIVHVRTSLGPGGSTYLDVTLHNASNGDIVLRGVRAALTGLAPWPAGDAVATGGSTMFAQPTIIHPQTGGNAAVASNAYLLHRGAQTHTLVGFLTWRTLHSQLNLGEGTVHWVARGESRIVPAGATLPLERIWIAQNPSWQNLLFDYAGEIARENRIVPKPRTAFVGWSNWDYYGGRFTTDQLLANLDALMAMKVGANLFQIDGNWWKHMGDYTESNDRLPGGVEKVSAAIRERGLRAGIHLDGARAALSAPIVQAHPDYFLRTTDGVLLGDRRSTGGPAGPVYFDFTHPGARAHLRETAARLRAAGFTYFKVDFLKFALIHWALKEAGYPPEATVSLHRHDSRLTSLEASRLALAELREGIGPDAFLLGCTAEFGPVLGLVDGLRTGGDIDPTFSRFSRSAMENGGVFHLNGTTVWSDADYIVVRARADEDATLTSNPRKTGGQMSEALATMWVHYTGLFGGPKLSGDNLTILRPERQALFRTALELPNCVRFVPLDFWARGRTRDDPYHAFLGEAEGAVYLALFNWTAEPRTYRLGLPAQTEGMTRATAVSVPGEVSLDRAGPNWTVRLPPQTSAVWRLDGAPFDALREELDIR